MRSFKVLAMLFIIGALVGKMYAQGTITIVTEKVVGQTDNHFIDFDRTRHCSCCQGSNHKYFQKWRLHRLHSDRTKRYLHRRYYDIRLRSRANHIGTVEQN